MNRRETSTEAELETAIGSTGNAQPCRWIYAKEVWADASLDRWPERVPPHAVIHAQNRELAHLSELLETYRAEKAALQAELARIKAAARTLNEAVDMTSLFDLERSS